MGLFKWAAKTTYYTGKSAVRGAGRSIARDFYEVAHPTYEHDGCSTRHRTPEAMLKCRKGNDYVAETRTRSPRLELSGPELDPNYLICVECNQVIPVELVNCTLCGATLIDEPCIECGGSWRVTRLNGELAGYCSICNWYITDDGLVRVV